MPTILDPANLETALADVHGWEGNTTGISRSVEFADFVEAIAVVNRVADVAEEMGHHPDIDIRWATVTFYCVTHSMGGVTEFDLKLAGRINAVVDAFTPTA